MNPIREFILSLLIVHFSLLGFGQTVKTISNQDALFYGEYLHVLEDQNFSIGIDSAISSFYAGDFEVSDKAVYSSPATSSISWFALTVANETPNELWGSISNAMFDTLHFYKVNLEKEIVLEQKCGTVYGREASYNNYFAFWFKLLDRGEEEHTFFFKTYSNILMEFPLQIGSKEELYKSKYQRETIISFFIGGMCFIFLYNFSLFFFMKERVYLYYSIYVFFVTSGSTLVNGFPFVESIFGIKFISEYSILLFLGVVISVILTTVSFLSIKRQIPFLYKVFLIEMVLAVILGISFMISELPILIKLMQLIAVVSFLTCVIASIIQSLKKIKSAQIFLIGWVVMLSGAVTQLMLINGIIEIDLNFRVIVIFPILIEVLIFSIALGFKIRQLKEQMIRLNMSLTQSNSELKSNNEAIDSFNYHVSHELKTVMNNGKALSKMAMKYIDKENIPKVKEILTKLNEVTSGGSDTVKSFLSLGQSNSFLQAEERAKINVADRIEQVISLVALEGKIEVELDSRSPDYILLHERAFDTFLSNFFTNTVKYNTSKKPKAIILIKVTSTETIISYTDNGIGIDMKTEGHKIFQPFVRINNALDQEGTGVGLYLVKKIVQNYEGTIKIDSELGQGVKIEVSIPTP